MSKSKHFLLLTLVTAFISVAFRPLGNVSYSDDTPAVSTLNEITFHNKFADVITDSAPLMDTVSASGAPILNTPTDGQVLLYNLPLFDWENVDGATSYTIQIAKNSTFTTLLLSKSVITSQFLPTTALPANLKLYWRVRGTFGSTAGAWSLTRNFFTANPPGVPSLLLPANGSLTTKYQPRLDWSTVSLPTGTFFDHYQLQIATDLSFNTPTVDHNVTDRSLSEYTLDAPLASNTKFYWRVRSHNTLGQHSSWSPVWSFRTALLPPVLSAPANDAINSIHTNLVAFSWSNPNGSGVTGYNIQISKNSTFTSIVKSASPTTTSFTTSLPVHTLLFWRVQAKGANGPSLWSSPAWSLLTGNPPSTPTLSAPTNGSLLANYNPLFKWNPSTFPSGTAFLHYQIQVSEDNTFSSTVIDTTTTTTQYLSDITPDPNKTYYWHIRAFNTNTDFSGWSATWSFHTPIQVPTLRAPEDAATAVDLKPTFSWSDSNGPGTNYTIQVSTSNSFDTVLLNATSTAPSYTPIVDLPADTTLYWHVQAKSTNGTSVWSQIFSLTTANPPSTPVIISPEDPLVTTITVPIRWTPSLHTGGWIWGVDQYELQIDNNSDFSTPEYDSFESACTYDWSSGMPIMDCYQSLSTGDQPPADGLYYVRVRDISSEGASNWSSTWSFHLQLGYADCSLLIPDDGDAANFSVSQSVEQGSPRIGSLRISPFLPSQGQVVTLTVSAAVKPYSDGSQPLDPITSITIDMITDHGTTAQIELSLISGTDTDGIWQGQWTVTDSYCYRYLLSINTTNAIATTKLTVGLRL